MGRSKKDRWIRVPVTAMTAVFVLLILLLVVLRSSPEETGAFQPLPDPQEEKFQWILVTREGGELSEYGCLLPDVDELESLAGVPVEVTVCTADKFMNLAAADFRMDVATRLYADPKMKRFETSGKALSLQQLLKNHFPGFSLSTDFLEWCGNTKGDVYAYPHTVSVAREAPETRAGVVMLANRALLEKYGIDGNVFSNKEETVKALKTIRRGESNIIPSYIDLGTLQQMFGARSVSPQGVWQDKFFQPETLEALEYLNRLFRERLLDGDVFTMTEIFLLSQLREGKVFLAATEDLYPLLEALPEDDPVWNNYEIVGPIVPDSGREFAFQYNYNEQYASTVFLAGSRFPEEQVRLLLRFCSWNMEFSEEQRDEILRAGFGDILEEDVVQPKAIGGIYDRYAQPTVPYEILFAHYADTRLANVSETIERYRTSQIVRIVTSTSADEVGQIYRETLLEMENRDVDLLVKWK